MTWKNLECEICGRRFVRAKYQPTCSPHCGQIKRVREHWAKKEAERGSAK